MERLTPRVVHLSAECKAIALAIGTTTAAKAIGHKVADTVVACTMASPALDSAFPFIMAMQAPKTGKYISNGTTPEGIKAPDR